jgi:hypothetical protein
LIGGGDVAERVDPALADLRALLGRVDQHHLEAGDWAVVERLLSEVIGEAEASGEELVIIGSRKKRKPLRTRYAEESKC